MKKFIFIFAVSVVISTMNIYGQGIFSLLDKRAQIVRQIEEPGLITVVIPDSLNSLLSFTVVETQPEAAESSEEHKSAKPAVRVGYRVLVFDDNNVRTAKQAAEERKELIESRFPEFKGYVEFNSPYWRVKVGDFRTRSEAESAMGAIRAAFPKISSQLRVVRDKINTR